MSNEGKTVLGLLLAGIVGGSVGYGIGQNQRQELEATINRQNAELLHLRQENSQLKLRNIELEAKTRNQKSILN